MMIKKIWIILLALLFAAVISGCSNRTPKQPDEVKSNQETQVSEEQQQQFMNEFQQLAEKPDVRPMEISRYIDQHLTQLSSQNAAQMVERLEQVQKKYLRQLDEKFYDESLQQRLRKSFSPGSDLNNLELVQEPGDKAFLQTTKENGYKLDTAEGMIYPIIDYSVYQRYFSRMPADIAAYYALMATESNKTSVKDAALVISWDEVIQRALEQEKFLQQYSNSAKRAAVQELYKNYTFIAFYGTNNTPLFDYETKTFRNEAKAAYEKLVGQETGSTLLAQLKNYLMVLNNNQYKLTDEVEQFRKTAVSQFLQ